MSISTEEFTEGEVFAFEEGFAGGHGPDSKLEDLEFDLESQVTVFFFFLTKWIPGQGPEQRESCKTVLYQLFSIIKLISYIIIKLFIKTRTIPSETGNRTR